MREMIQNGASMSMSIGPSQEEETKEKTGTAHESKEETE